MSNARIEDDEFRVEEMILDYIATCEKFGALDFNLFVEVWRDADAIARRTVAYVSQS